MSTDTVNEDEFDMFNEVLPDDQLKDNHKEYLTNANELRDKHRDLKESFDNLERKSAGRGHREFVEPKVINLWNKALEGNFTPKELAALKEELLHFESKLLKLSHLYADHVVSSDKYKVCDNFVIFNDDGTDINRWILLIFSRFFFQGKADKKAGEKLENMEKNIKKQARKVEKLQESLEKQIYRHPEL